MQSVPEVLKQAFAMQPGTKKEIAVALENGLCAKVCLSQSTLRRWTLFLARKHTKISGWMTKSKRGVHPEQSHKEN